MSILFIGDASEKVVAEKGTWSKVWIHVHVRSTEKNKEHLRASSCNLDKKRGSSIDNVSKNWGTWPGTIRYPVVKCYQFLVLAMASRKNFEDEKISLTRLRYLVYKHFLTFDFFYTRLRSTST